MKPDGDRFELLYNISRRLNSTLDLDAVLEVVMDDIVELTGAERGVVGLLSEAGEVEVWVGRDLDRGSIEDETFKVSRGLIEQVVREARPVLTNDASRDPLLSARMSVRAMGLRSILCVPLLAKDTMIGLIYVDNRMLCGIFDDDDLDLLVAFSHQAAIAIENARLFASLQARIREVVMLQTYQEAVLQSIASGVIALDPDNRVVTMNRAGESIFACRRTEISELDQLFPTSVQSSVGAMLDRALRTQKEIQGERLAFHREGRGEVWLELAASPLSDPQGVPIGTSLTAEDMTERHQLELARRAEERKRHQVQDLFGRMVSHDVMQELIDDPDRYIVGVRRRVTFLFADINDFTSTCEQRPPDQVIDMLNRYFTEMNRIIFAQNGTIKQFVGDEVMVMFGAPREMDDHAERAVHTGLAMVERLNQLGDLDPSGQQGFYRVKIGIHTGEVVVGRVGSSERFEYAAVGDTVNLAKRIQDLNKKLGSTLLVSGSTFREVGSMMNVMFVPKGEHEVKGRRESIAVYSATRSHWNKDPQ